MKVNRIQLRYITYLLIVILFSCKSKKEHYIEVSTYNDTRPINELKELVLTKGDTVAYDELGLAFDNENYPEEYLLYSFIMADKYNYSRAYFQVYYCLTSAFEHHSMTIDSISKNIAIRYLKKGVDLYEIQSIMSLSELYMEGKYVPKDTIKGKRLKKMFDKMGGYRIH